MTVVGISMVRDEADIIHPTVSNMLEQVDHVIVADNGSIDGTRDVLEHLGVDLILDDTELGYYQSRKMTMLARLATREFDATHVVPFDADEWWYSPHGRVADVIEAHADWPVIAADLYDHVATGTDRDELDPTKRIGWRRVAPAPLPKVACLAAEDLSIDQGNHGATYDAPAPVLTGMLEIRHFPYRSPEQFARKALNGAQAYAATNLPLDMGQHWREYGRLAEENGPEVLHDVFRRWFWTADPASDPGLIFDPIT